jgi:DNA polymerase (family 10)
MTMTNQELAAAFDRIADLLEIKGEVIYKTIAYRRAAESLRGLSQEAAEIRAAGSLTDIPGVGKAIAEKMTELLDTGRLEFLARLESEVPPSLLELLEVPDIGPKKANALWSKAGITNLQELEAAARAGKIRALPGMGEKTEQRILEGIAALQRRTTRLPLGTALPEGERWLAWLKAQPGVVQADLAGSLRRRKLTIGDLDLVAAAADPAPIMQAFTHHENVERIIGQGEAKASVQLKNGINIQLWIQPPQKYASLLQFVTGSKEHNVRLRELAQRQGFSLSEHGISQADGGQEWQFASEAELYQALGLPWIAPELREDRGEIQAALANRLPQLIERSDLRAELHSHSTWSDGSESIRNMVSAAQKRGHTILAVTDHSQSLGIANGLTPERLRQQRAEIDALQAERGSDFLILQGAEVEIKADGSLDYPDEVLASLDIVVASLHVSLRQPREEVTARLIRAIRNPHVDIIGHPSGRLLPNREGADLDWEAVFAAARETNTVLEINAHPERLDLDDVHARRAIELGIRLSIDTDAHQPGDMDYAPYGISVARRAWVTAEQVINTWPAAKLRAWLKLDKSERD